VIDALFSKVKWSSARHEAKGGTYRRLGREQQAACLAAGPIAARLAELVFGKEDIDADALAVVRSRP
jgi:hypothetical protein